MALTANEILKRDGNKVPVLGIICDATGYVMKVHGDETARSIHTSGYVWNGTAWVAAAQGLENVTDLENLVTAGNAVLAAIDQAVDDQRMNYLYSGTLDDSGNTYVGYEDKGGAYYIVKYDSSDDPTYTAGTDGIPDKSTASNWTGLTYASAMDTF